MSFWFRRIFAVREHLWQWVYLVSLLVAGVWQALLNAPSGYAPILCGSNYPDTPCVSYSWLDAYPQWVGGMLWFVGIASNVACLVLLFKLGSVRELLRTSWWLLAIFVLGMLFVVAHKWHVVIREIGVVVDDSALHRWDAFGLIHNGLEYAVLPLAFVGLVVLTPTALVRRRRERRAEVNVEVASTQVR